MEGNQNHFELLVTLLGMENSSRWLYSFFNLVTSHGSSFIVLGSYFTCFIYQWLWLFLYCRWTHYVIFLSMLFRIRRWPFNRFCFEPDFLSHDEWMRARILPLTHHSRQPFSGISHSLNVFRTPSRNWKDNFLK